MPELMTVPEPLTRALLELSERLATCPDLWLVGGSSGLLLQDVNIGSVPRDLDVYMDEPSGAAHLLLKDAALDQPEFSRTEQYRSTLSHYSLHGVTVELVAGFEVRAPGAHYTVRIREQAAALAPRYALGGRTVLLMPLAHELLFNMLRNRPDRYTAIAEAIKRDRETHLPAVGALLKGSDFDEAWTRRVGGLLGVTARELLGEADSHA
ncbi:hypothetical protein [Paenibacillus thermotolerans]|uniref:hypothetical protein n=1 Tax=Paenibacillus thermotolerans TaxID=3027807 RepID=UPI002367E57B|nr:MULTISPECIES: hypothetical protein [unclassified Paenibacillus]